MNWNYQQQRYFLYDPEGEGMVYFDTEEERDNAAKEAINDYLDCDVWSEEVVNVVTGIVTHSAQRTNVVERPPDSEIDENGFDEDGDYWDGDCRLKCDYEMKPISSD